MYIIKENANFGAKISVYKNTNMVFFHITDQNKKELIDDPSYGSFFKKIKNDREISGDPYNGIKTDEDKIKKLILYFKKDNKRAKDFDYVYTGFQKPEFATKKLVEVFNLIFN